MSSARDATDAGMPETSAGAVAIRKATVADAAAVAHLTSELGYSAEPPAIATRLARIGARADQVVFVAMVDGTVGGWIQVCASDALESGFRAEIVGLIVGRGFRRRGVGRQLVDRATQWARRVGAEAVVVRSNTVRQESHRFYPALGFAAVKTQAVYSKLLNEPPATDSNLKHPSL